MIHYPNIHCSITCKSSIIPISIELAMNWLNLSLYKNNGWAYTISQSCHEKDGETKACRRGHSYFDLLMPMWILTFDPGAYHQLLQSIQALPCQLWEWPTLVRYTGTPLLMNGAGMWKVSSVASIVAKMKLHESTLWISLVNWHNYRKNAIYIELSY